MRLYDEKVNFWAACPQLLLVNDIKDYWRKDKSRDHKESSDFLWKIVLCYHPESDLYNISTKELHCFGDKFDSVIESNKNVIDILRDALIPQELKSLDEWNKKMKDRDTFLTQQTYTFGYIDDEGREYKDNTKSLDEMLARTSKLYDNLKLVKEEVEKMNSKVAVESKSKGWGDRNDF